jgi:hypothetical protein
MTCDICLSPITLEVGLAAARRITDPAWLAAWVASLSAHESALLAHAGDTAELFGQATGALRRLGMSYEDIRRVFQIGTAMLERAEAEARAELQGGPV